MFFFVAICSILFGLALYHLIIYLVTRDKVYVYFTVYSISACCTSCISKDIFWRAYISILPCRFIIAFAFAFTCIAFYIALLIYVRNLCRPPQVSPRWDKALQAVFLIAVMTVAISPFTDSHFFNDIKFCFDGPILLLEISGVCVVAHKNSTGKNLSVGLHVAHHWICR